MRGRLERLLRLSGLILFGASAAIAQIIFLREFLVVASGNELLLGILFACWFAGIVVGAWLAGFFADKVRSPRAWTLGLLVVQVSILPVIVYFIRSFRLTMGVPMGQYIPFGTLLWGAALHIVPFSVITGIAFPLFCKWLAQDAPERHSIGWAYFYESLGSVVGSLVYTFYFVTHWQTFTTVFLVGLLMALCSCALSLAPRKRTALPALIFGVISIAFLSLLASDLSARLERVSIARRWKAIGGEMELIKTINSRYQNLELARQADQYSVAGNGEFFSSFPDEYGEASRVHFIMAQHPAARRILLIGGGDEGLLPHLLLYPLERLDYVELDEAILDLVADHLPPSVKDAVADRRVHVHHVDGRYFVKQQATSALAEQDKYDLVILSLPEPSTAVINRFYTREFFTEIKTILKPDGVAATSIGSAVNYFGETIVNYAGSVYKSLRETFADVVITPGEKAYLFASQTRGIVTTNIETLIRRFSATGIETPYFSQYAFYTLLQSNQVELARDAMEKGMSVTDDNTDLRPITYFYNLMLWAKFSGSKSEWFFRTIRQIRLWHVALLLAVLLASRLIYVRVRSPRFERVLAFNAGFLIVGTGLAGMASEIILLYLFQNTYGYVYQKVGLIVALFMVGLALGSFSMTRLLPKSMGTVLRTVVIVEVCIIAYSGGLIFMISRLAADAPGAPLGWHGVEILFYASVMLGGLLTGAEFPLVGQIFLLSRKAVGVSAAFVDSADHLGAGVGAFCAGVVIVPILGIVQSLVALMLLKAAGLVLILTSGMFSSREHHS